METTIASSSMSQLPRLLVYPRNSSDEIDDTTNGPTNTTVPNNFAVAIALSDIASSIMLQTILLAEEFLVFSNFLQHEFSFQLQLLVLPFLEAGFDTKITHGSCSACSNFCGWHLDSFATIIIFPPNFYSYEGLWTAYSTVRATQHTTHVMPNLLYSTTAVCAIALFGVPVQYCT